jgi:uncharacterized protein
MTRHFIILFSLLIGLLHGEGCAQVTQSSAIYSSYEGIPEVDDIVVYRNTMIPMNDGIQLATDIYVPRTTALDNKNRLPVMIQRTPYGKSADRFVPAAINFARQGYIVALQDIRGRYDSQGAFTKYSPLEASDGATTVTWLSHLPFANGKVGMWGTSYAAHAQADASKMRPEGLSALILNMGGMANAWDHAVRQGGAFELGRELTWAFRQIPADIKDPVVQKHFELEKVEDWYEVWPFRKGLNPLSIAPNFEEYILEEAKHSDYDDYWKEIGINWEEYYDQTMDIPMVHVGGWYDIFLRGTINNYLALSQKQKSPKWLIIGPWTHGGNHKTFAGEVDFGPDAAITDFHQNFQTRWFDYLLKDQKAIDLPEKSISLFVMGTGDGHKDAEGRLQHGGHWIESDTWPLTGTISSTYYFHQDGSLSADLPTQESSHTTFTFDPHHPVPTLGGNVSVRVKDGAYNQRERPDFVGSQPPYLPLKSRADVVSFQTEPLSEDMQIIGPITLKLFCKSTGVDTDFTVKLVDVYPPSEDFPGGFDMNLTDGIVRMSYRNDRRTRDLITPDQIYDVTINPFPTANVFKKGHRIRVDISSSNFPRWDVNPNTGEPLGQNRRMIIVDNTIVHSSTFPSYIVLPIVPMN